MSLSQYLERADSEKLTVSQMYQEGAYEEIIELLDEGKVKGAEVEVSRSYANEVMYDKDWMDHLDTVSEILAEGVSAFPRLDNIYQDGFEQADRKMQEINNKHSGSSARSLVKKKAKNDETKMKVSEGLISGGIGGFVLSNHLGSQLGMATSAAAGGIGVYGTAKTKGSKDRTVEEAAKGLEMAFGGYEIKID